LTPRQSDALTRIVVGFFGFAPIGLLMLLVRGYHTLLLSLIGVMFGIGALTFTYDRSSTLVGLAMVAGVGILSLIVQGYQTLVLILMGVIFGIGALAFIHQMWHAWYPDEHIGPLVRRYTFRVLQLLAVALASVQVRASINMLTGVEPGNFPTALAALTALLALPAWLVVIPFAALVMFVVYAAIAYLAGLGREVGFTHLRGLSPGGWAFRVFGAVSLIFICSMAYGLPAEHPAVQRVARIIAASVLVATQFSYDQTCAVSSKERWVARLQDRKEMKASMVSIADVRSLFDIRFTTGTCDQAIDPPQARPDVGVDRGGAEASGG
jgi:hypothetical protein